MSKGRLEGMRRCLRTVFFMAAMAASLIVLAAPFVVLVGDVMVPSVLISNFTCVGCYSVREHIHRYTFRKSLIDIPLVSVIRSVIIACIYSVCDASSLSQGSYFGAVTFCSISSVVLLSIKACIFTMNAETEAETLSYFSQHKLHLKKSWGMPVLFLSSVVFALGHLVVAYRTSCRARRKLLLHRLDPEAILSCKNVLRGFYKVPRSPIPAKNLKNGSGAKITPKGHEGEELSVALLADVDSLFTTYGCVTLHYKLSISTSSRPCLNLARSSSSSISDKAVFNALNKNKYLLHRSCSNQFQSSLCDPLLESYAGSLDEIPMMMSVDGDVDAEGEDLENGNVGKDARMNESFGIVLVHGFGGGVFSWRHVMGSLAHGIGCSVAAFDRPGWGLTSRPRRKEWENNHLPNPYKLDTQVDLLLSFCLEMGFSSVTLIGHDDGGLLALRAAQKVKTSTTTFNVTIIGVILLGVSLCREVVPAFARILLRTSLGKKHLVRPLLQTEITQVVNRRAWYDSTKLTAEILAVYKAPLCVDGWEEALHEISKLSSETVLPKQSAALLLKAVEGLPVLVVAGAEDALVPLKFAQALASQLTNSRMVTISGCGHLPHEECPKALFAAMSSFINRILTYPVRETII